MCWGLSLMAMAPCWAKSPNVVLITIDTLRADRVGCYGYKPARTPTLDALAREGVWFRTVVAPAPLTFPSHCSILTGTYPPTHGVRDNLGYTLSSTQTLARILKSHQYAAGAFVGAYVLDASRGLNQGFDTYSSPFRVKAASPDTLVRNLQYLRRPAEAVVADALEWLQRKGESPFFMWVHLYDPHTPYDPPARFRALLQDPYDGEIAYADYALGRLIDYLKANRLYEGTLIIATSDHGESFGEHGEYSHGYFIYDTTLLVPLILKPPGQTVVPSHRIDRPVRSIDIAPTILQFAGAPILSTMQGASLVALVLGKSDVVASRAAYAESYYPNEFGWSALRCLREERFKFIDAPKPELYDLVHDPAEVHNVYSGHRAVALALKAELERISARLKPQQAAPAPSASQMDVELLRSLGYVGMASPIPPSATQRSLPDPKDKLTVYKVLSAATEQAYRGEYRRAATSLDSLVQKEPSLFPAFLLLAKCRLALGEFDAAENALSVASHLRPEEPEVRFYKAVCDYNRGRMEAARSAFELIAETRSEEPFVHLYLGVIHQREGRPEAALAEFRKAVQIFPDFEEARYKIGFILARMGNYAEAIEEFKKVCSLDPTNAQAHYNLGLAYARTGDVAEARQERATACSLKPALCEAESRK
jgi:arylsulfatase A-like enzyme/Flp pilus assembly protein TadD